MSLYLVAVLDNSFPSAFIACHAGIQTFLSLLRVQNDLIYIYITHSFYIINSLTHTPTAALCDLTGT